MADSLLGDVPATVPVHERRLALALLAVPAACLGASALMGLVLVSDPPPQLVGHLDQFAEGRALYKLGFVGASLIAPTFIATLVLLLHAARVPPDAARRGIAGILLAGYLTLATIAYSSQYTFLPTLVDRDPQVAALWYLHDAGSITYALDLSGYALLALAAITIATTLWGHAGRLRAIAACLVAMGVLSLAALGFHAGELSSAASVATISSAAFTLPVLVLTILLGRDLHRRSRSPDTTEGDVHP